MKTQRLKPKKKMKVPKKAKNELVTNVRDKLFIGIDNGVTASIGAICNNKTWFFKTPIKMEQNYTKKKGNISRVIYKDLLKILKEIRFECGSVPAMVLIERPMVNPGRFSASISAVRALETTLDVIEELELPYQYEDSKAWQKELLPAGTKGDVALKLASKTIGCRLFPQHAALIRKHKDADGILMAEYCRRKF